MRKQTKEKGERAGNLGNDQTLGKVGLYRRSSPRESRASALPDADTSRCSERNTENQAKKGTRQMTPGKLKVAPRRDVTISQYWAEL